MYSKEYTQIAKLSEVFISFKILVVFPWYLDPNPYNSQIELLWWLKLEDNDNDVEKKNCIQAATGEGLMMISKIGNWSDQSKFATNQTIPDWQPTRPIQIGNQLDQSRQ